MLTHKESIAQLAQGIMTTTCYECSELYVPVAIVRRWQSAKHGNAYTLHCMNCGAEYTHHYSARQVSRGVIYEEYIEG